MRFNSLDISDRFTYKLNGKLSSPFLIRRWTRQALFSLVMEPLTEALRALTRVAGICVDSIVEKLSLFADDLILFLRVQSPTLLEELRILERFAALSGLHTNWGKSLILPIDLGAKAVVNPNSSLQWETIIRYLGVNISSIIVV